VVNKRRDVDWEAIKNSYRCAVPSIRTTAKIYGVSEGTIRARAKREGWQQDLARAVREQAREKLKHPEQYAAHLPKPASRTLRPLSDTQLLAAIPRSQLLALQREDMADCTARWRSWGEQRLYRDIDGRVHSLGWNEPKRERPRCGARTRAGGLCKAPAILGKERCRMHGGLATGPKTAEGKARSLAAAREGYRRWRDARQKQGAHP
jgi:hypothetical protein